MFGIRKFQPLITILPIEVYRPGLQTLVTNTNPVHQETYGDYPEREPGGCELPGI